MASFERPTNKDIPPSPWVTRFSHLIPAGGHVLDLAAGLGRHTRYFLEHGYEVTAADIDMSELPEQERLTRLEADLEAQAWPFPAEGFDAVVMTNYLHRPHYPHLMESLAVGGVLIIETFGEGNEQHGRPRNPDFLLKPGELLDAFGDKLYVVAYEHGVELTPRPAVRQRLCAIKGGGSVSLSSSKG